MIANQNKISWLEPQQHRHSGLRRAAALIKDDGVHLDLLVEGLSVLPQHVASGCDRAKENSSIGKQASPRRHRLGPTPLGGFGHYIAIPKKPIAHALEKVGEHISFAKKGPNEGFALASPTRFLSCAYGCI